MKYILIRYCSLLFTFVSWLGVCAQPTDNPLVVSSENLDVVGGNLMSDDSCFYFTANYRTSSSRLFDGSYVVKYDYTGSIQDSIAIDFLPDSLYICSAGFMDNDSLTIFVSQPVISDTISSHYIIRLSKDFGGYRYQQMFSHGTCEGVFDNVGVIEGSGNYYAHLNRANIFDPKTNYYVEIDSKSLDPLRIDTLFLPTPVGLRGMVDFMLYKNKYYGLYLDRVRKYDLSMNLIGEFTYSGRGSNGDKWFGVPLSLKEIGGNLYIGGNWLKPFDQSFHYTAIMGIDEHDSTWYTTYPNPYPNLYINEYFNQNGLDVHENYFLLTSTLNVDLSPGSKYAANNDILIRLIDTNTLTEEYHYLLTDSCKKFVVSTSSTPFGFAVMYLSNCDLSTANTQVNLAFFNNKAQLLRTKTFGNIPSSFSLRVYPNPVVNMLNWKVSDFGENKVWNVELYNSSGVLEIRNQVQGNKGSLSLEGWSKGVYYLELKSEGGVELTQKIVKR